MKAGIEERGRSVLRKADLIRTYSRPRDFDGRRQKLSVPAEMTTSTLGDNLQIRDLLGSGGCLLLVHCLYVLLFYCLLCVLTVFFLR